MFRRDLEKDIASETSGHFKRVLIASVQGNRVCCPFTRIDACICKSVHCMLIHGIYSCCVYCMSRVVWILHVFVYCSLLMFSTFIRPSLYRRKAFPLILKKPSARPVSCTKRVKRNSGSFFFFPLWHDCRLLDWRGHIFTLQIVFNSLISLFNVGCDQLFAQCICL